MRLPNEQHKAQRHDEILKIAAGLFAHSNYHEVKMDDVARLAGIAKGTLYNYFSTKEELYISIITDRMSSLLNLLRDRIDHKQTPLTNLRRIIVHIYSFMCKYRPFFQIWYKEKLRCDQHSHQEIYQLYSEIRLLLSKALQRGIDERILKTHDVAFVADMVLGVVDATVLRSGTLETMQRREEAKRIFRFILDAIGTEAARQKHLAGEDEPVTIGEAAVVFTK